MMSHNENFPLLDRPLTWQERRPLLLDALEIMSEFILISSDEISNRWKVERARESVFRDFRRTGWNGQTDTEIFQALDPKHPMFPEVRAALRTKRGKELNPLIQAARQVCIAHAKEDALMNITPRNFATEPEPGLSPLVESIQGRMAVAHAFELASDYALAQEAEKVALESGEEPKVATPSWKLGYACRSYFADLQKAGYRGESLETLFFALFPEHPSHSALLRVLTEMPKGSELKAHIEAGYLASFRGNHRNAVPIQIPH